MLRRKQHAVVMGASVAGILAARALADHFDAVTVVDRDALPDNALPREGVPQGRHIHVLLPGGARALDRFFPGRLADLVRDGAQRFDYGLSRFHMLGEWMPRIETKLYTFAQTRPFFELHLRQWMREFPHVRFVPQASVVEPIFDPPNSRVLGVKLRRSGASTAEELRAELVVDATGRNTRLPAWLKQWGQPGVPQSTVGFDLGYATGQFRVPAPLLPDHPMLYIVGRPPHRTRVGVITQLENGAVYSGMGGYCGDHPPADLPGFLAFAKGLSDPHIFDVLSASELVAPIARYRIPSSIRRHYGRLARFPNGILPLGDSLCSFDPAFGQGMAVAALEAQALSESLERATEVDETLRRDYFRRVDAVVDVAWDLSSGENFKYPRTTGSRPLLFPVTRRFKDRLARCGDSDVITAFYHVVSLTAPPKTLLRPSVIARTLGLKAKPRAHSAP